MNLPLLVGVFILLFPLATTKEKIFSHNGYKNERDEVLELEEKPVFKRYCCSKQYDTFPVPYKNTCLQQNQRLALPLNFNKPFVNIPNKIIKYGHYPVGSSQCQSSGRNIVAISNDEEHVRRGTEGTDESQNRYELTKTTSPLIISGNVGYNTQRNINIKENKSGNLVKDQFYYGLPRTSQKVRITDYNNCCSQGNIPPHEYETISRLGYPQYGFDPLQSKLESTNACEVSLNETFNPDTSPKLSPSNIKESTELYGYGNETPSLIYPLDSSDSDKIYIFGNEPTTNSYPDSNGSNLDINDDGNANPWNVNLNTEDSENVYSYGTTDKNPKYIENNPLISHNKSPNNARNLDTFGYGVKTSLMSQPDIGKTTKLFSYGTTNETPEYSGSSSTVDTHDKKCSPDNSESTKVNEYGDENLSTDYPGTGESSKLTDIFAHINGKETPKYTGNNGLSIYDIFKKETTDSSKISDEVYGYSSPENLTNQSDQENSQSGSDYQPKDSNEFDKSIYGYYDGSHERPTAGQISTKPSVPGEYGSEQFLSTHSNTYGFGDDQFQTSIDMSSESYDDPIKNEGVFENPKSLIISGCDDSDIFKKYNKYQSHSEVKGIPEVCQSESDESYISPHTLGTEEKIYDQYGYQVEDDTDKLSCLFPMYGYIHDPHYSNTHSIDDGMISQPTGTTSTTTDNSFDNNSQYDELGIPIKTPQQEVDPLNYRTIIDDGSGVQGFIPQRTSETNHKYLPQPTEYRTGTTPTITGNPLYNNNQYSGLDNPIKTPQQGVDPLNYGTIIDDGSGVQGFVPQRTSETIHKYLPRPTEYGTGTTPTITGNPLYNNNQYGGLDNPIKTPQQGVDPLNYGTIIDDVSGVQGFIPQPTSETINGYLPQPPEYGTGTTPTINGNPLYNNNQYGGLDNPIKTPQQGVDPLNYGTIIDNGSGVQGFTPQRTSETINGYLPQPTEYGTGITPTNTGNPLYNNNQYGGLDNPIKTPQQGVDPLNYGTIIDDGSGVQGFVPQRTSETIHKYLPQPTEYGTGTAPTITGNPLYNNNQYGGLDNPIKTPQRGVDPLNYGTIIDNGSGVQGFTPQRTSETINGYLPQPTEYGTGITPTNTGNPLYNNNQYGGLDNPIKTPQQGVDPLNYGTIIDDGSGVQGFVPQRTSETIHKYLPQPTEYGTGTTPTITGNPLYNNNQYSGLDNPIKTPQQGVDPLNYGTIIDDGSEVQGFVPQRTSETIHKYLPQPTEYGTGTAPTITGNPLYNINQYGGLDNPIKSPQQEVDPLNYGNIIDDGSGVQGFIPQRTSETIHGYLPQPPDYGTGITPTNTGNPLYNNNQYGGLDNPVKTPQQGVDPLNYGTIIDDGSGVQGFVPQRTSETIHKYLPQPTEYGTGTTPTITGNPLYNNNQYGGLDNPIKTPQQGVDPLNYGTIIDDVSGVQGFIPQPTSETINGYLPQPPEYGTGTTPTINGHPLYNNNQYGGLDNPIKTPQQGVDPLNYGTIIDNGSGVQGFTPQRTSETINGYLPQPTEYGTGITPTNTGNPLYNNNQYGGLDNPIKTPQQGVDPLNYGTIIDDGSGVQGFVPQRTSETIHKYLPQPTEYGTGTTPTITGNPLYNNNQYSGLDNPIKTPQQGVDPLNYGTIIDNGSGVQGFTPQRTSETINGYLPQPTEYGTGITPTNTGNPLYNNNQYGGLDNPIKTPQQGVDPLNYGTIIDDGSGVQGFVPQRTSETIHKYLPQPTEYGTGTTPTITGNPLYNNNQYGGLDNPIKTPQQGVDPLNYGTIIDDVSGVQGFIPQPTSETINGYLPQPPEYGTGTTPTNNGNPLYNNNQYGGLDNPIKTPQQGVDPLNYGTIIDNGSGVQGFTPQRTSETINGYLPQPTEYGTGITPTNTGNPLYNNNQYGGLDNPIKTPQQGVDPLNYGTIIDDGSGVQGFVPQRTSETIHKYLPQPPEYGIGTTPTINGNPLYNNNQYGELDISINTPEPGVHPLNYGTIIDNGSGVQGFTPQRTSETINGYLPQPTEYLTGITPTNTGNPLYNNNQYGGLDNPIKSPQQEVDPLTYGTKIDDGSGVQGFNPQRTSKTINGYLPQPTDYETGTTPTISGNPLYNNNQYGELDILIKTPQQGVDPFNYGTIIDDSSRVQGFVPQRTSESIHKYLPQPTEYGTGTTPTITGNPLYNNNQYGGLDNPIKTPQQGVDPIKYGTIIDDVSGVQGFTPQRTSETINGYLPQPTDYETGTTPTISGNPLYNNNQYGELDISIKTPQQGVDPLNYGTIIDNGSGVQGFVPQRTSESNHKYLPQPTEYGTGTAPTITGNPLYNNNQYSGLDNPIKTPQQGVDPLNYGTIIDDGSGVQGFVPQRTSETIHKYLPRPTEYGTGTTPTITGNPLYNNNQYGGLDNPIKTPQQGVDPLNYGTIIDDVSGVQGFIPQPTSETINGYLPQPPEYGTGTTPTINGNPLYNNNQYGGLDNPIKTPQQGVDPLNYGTIIDNGSGVQGFTPQRTSETINGYLPQPTEYGTGITPTNTGNPLYNNNQYGGLDNPIKTPQQGVDPLNYGTIIDDGSGVQGFVPQRTSETIHKYLPQPTEYGTGTAPTITGNPLYNNNQYGGLDNPIKTPQRGVDPLNYGTIIDNGSGVQGFTPQRTSETINGYLPQPTEYGTGITPTNTGNPLYNNNQYGGLDNPIKTPQQGVDPLNYGTIIDDGSGVQGFVPQRTSETIHKYLPQPTEYGTGTTPTITGNPLYNNNQYSGLDNPIKTPQQGVDPLNYGTIIDDGSEVQGFVPQRTSETIHKYLPQPTEYGIGTAPTITGNPLYNNNQYGGLDNPIKSPQQEVDPLNYGNIIDDGSGVQGFIPQRTSETIHGYLPQPPDYGTGITPTNTGNPLYNNNQYGGLDNPVKTPQQGVDPLNYGTIIDDGSGVQGFVPQRTSETIHKYLPQPTEYGTGTTPTITGNPLYNNNQYGGLDNPIKTPQQGVDPLNYGTIIDDVSGVQGFIPQPTSETINGYLPQPPEYGTGTTPTINGNPLYNNNQYGGLDNPIKTPQQGVDPLNYGTIIANGSGVQGFTPQRTSETINGYLPQPTEYGTGITPTNTGNPLYNNNQYGGLDNPIKTPQQGVDPLNYGTIIDDGSGVQGFVPQRTSETIHKYLPQPTEYGTGTTPTITGNPLYNNNQYSGLDNPIKTPQQGVDPLNYGTIIDNGSGVQGFTPQRTSETINGYLPQPTEYGTGITPTNTGNPLYNNNQYGGLDNPIKTPQQGVDPLNYGTIIDDGSGVQGFVPQRTSETIHKYLPQPTEYGTGTTPTITGNPLYNNNQYGGLDNPIKTPQQGVDPLNYGTIIDDVSGVQGFIPQPTSETINGYLPQPPEYGTGTTPTNNGNPLYNNNQYGGLDNPIKTPQQGVDPLNYGTIIDNGSGVQGFTPQRTSETINGYLPQPTEYGTGITPTNTGNPLYNNNQYGGLDNPIKTPQQGVDPLNYGTIIDDGSGVQGFVPQRTSETIHKYLPQPPEYGIGTTPTINGNPLYNNNQYGELDISINTPEPGVHPLNYGTIIDNGSGVQGFTPQRTSETINGYLPQPTEYLTGITPTNTGNPLYNNNQYGGLDNPIKSPQQEVDPLTYGTKIDDGSGVQGFNPQRTSKTINGYLPQPTDYETGTTPTISGNPLYNNNQYGELDILIKTPQQGVDPFNYGTIIDDSSRVQGFVPQRTSESNHKYLPQPTEYGTGTTPTITGNPLYNNNQYGGLDNPIKTPQQGVDPIKYGTIIDDVSGVQGFTPQRTSETINGYLPQPTDYETGTTPTISGNPLYNNNQYGELDISIKTPQQGVDPLNYGTIIDNGSGVQGFVPQRTSESNHKYLPQPTDYGTGTTPTITGNPLYNNNQYGGLDNPIKTPQHGVDPLNYGTIIDDGSGVQGFVPQRTSETIHKYLPQPTEYGTGTAPTITGNPLYNNNQYGGLDNPIKTPQQGVDPLNYGTIIDDGSGVQGFVPQRTSETIHKYLPQPTDYGTGTTPTITGNPLYNNNQYGGLDNPIKTPQHGVDPLNYGTIIDVGSGVQGFVPQRTSETIHKYLPQPTEYGTGTAPTITGNPLYNNNQYGGLDNPIKTPQQGVDPLNYGTRIDDGSGVQGFVPQRTSETIHKYLPQPTEYGTGTTPTITGNPLYNNNQYGGLDNAIKTPQGVDPLNYGTVKDDGSGVQGFIPQRTSETINGYLPLPTEYGTGTTPTNTGNPLYNNNQYGGLDNPIKSPQQEVDPLNYGTIIDDGSGVQGFIPQRTSETINGYLPQPPDYGTGITPSNTGNPLYNNNQYVGLDNPIETPQQGVGPFNYGTKIDDGSGVQGFVPQRTSETIHKYLPQPTEYGTGTTPTITRNPLYNNNNQYGGLDNPIRTPQQGVDPLNYGTIIDDGPGVQGFIPQRTSETIHGYLPQPPDYGTGITPTNTGNPLYNNNQYGGLDNPIKSPQQEVDPLNYGTIIDDGSGVQGFIPQRTSETIHKYLPQPTEYGTGTTPTNTGNPLYNNNQYGGLDNPIKTPQQGVDPINYGTILDDGSGVQGFIPQRTSETIHKYLPQPTEYGTGTTPTITGNPLYNNNQYGGLDNPIKTPQQGVDPINYGTILDDGSVVQGFIPQRTSETIHKYLPQPTEYGTGTTPTITGNPLYNNNQYGGLDNPIKTPQQGVDPINYGTILDDGSGVQGFIPQRTSETIHKYLPQPTEYGTGTTPTNTGNPLYNNNQYGGLDNPIKTPQQGVDPINYGTILDDGSGVQGFVPQRTSETIHKYLPQPTDYGTGTTPTITGNPPYNNNQYGGLDNPIKTPQQGVDPLNYGTIIDDGSVVQGFIPQRTSETIHKYLPQPTEYGTGTTPTITGNPLYNNNQYGGLDNPIKTPQQGVDPLNYGTKIDDGSVVQGFIPQRTSETIHKYLPQPTEYGTGTTPTITGNPPYNNNQYGGLDNPIKTPQQGVDPLNYGTIIDDGSVVQGFIPQRTSETIHKYFPQPTEYGTGTTPTITGNPLYNNNQYGGLDNPIKTPQQGVDPLNYGTKIDDGSGVQGFNPQRTSETINGYLPQPTGNVPQQKEYETETITTITRNPSLVDSYAYSYASSAFKPMQNLEGHNNLDSLSQDSGLVSCQQRNIQQQNLSSAPTPSTSTHNQEGDESCANKEVAFYDGCVMKTSQYQDIVGSVKHPEKCVLTVPHLFSGPLDKFVHVMKSFPSSVKRGEAFVQLPSGLLVPFHCYDYITSLVQGCSNPAGELLSTGEYVDSSTVASIVASANTPCENYIITINDEVVPHDIYNTYINGLTAEDKKRIKVVVPNVKQPIPYSIFQEIYDKYTSKVDYSGANGGKVKLIRSKTEIPLKVFLAIINNFYSLRKATVTLPSKYTISLARFVPLSNILGDEYTKRCVVNIPNSEYSVAFPLLKEIYEIYLNRRSEDLRNDTNVNLKCNLHGDCPQPSDVEVFEGDRDCIIKI